jgi:hypothetical protein
MGLRKRGPFLLGGVAGKYIARNKRTFRLLGIRTGFEYPQAQQQGRRGNAP